MKKFIPWRKASTVLILLVIVSISPYVYRQISVDWRKDRDNDKTTQFKENESFRTERNSNDSTNYGVVVDCGSSGSRVFVYHWEPHSGLPNHLLNIKIMRNSTDHPVILKIKPGLSSLHKQPSEASNYLSPLLQFASDNIPKHKIRETPLFIFATAGVRLLPLEEQTDLLNDIRTDVGLDYDFIFYKSHVEVISGEHEAIYAWTAINHALGKFGHELNDDPLVQVEVSGKIHVRKKTVGMLDLGGASLQMALEIPQTYSFSDPRVKGNLFEFNLGCSSDELSHKYKLYAKTFLSHGSDKTRTKYLEWLSMVHLNSSKTVIKSGDTLHVTDPCLSLSSTESMATASGTTFLMNGSGDLEECRRSLRQFLNKNVDCVLSNKRRCSIDGAILPDMNFRNVEFYGFSEFYYTMQDVLEIGGPYIFHHFKDKARDYCSTNWSTIESWKNSSRFPRADVDRYRLQCFKSAWVLEILHEGLNFPSSYRHFTSIQDLHGYEIHWSLGAIIHKTKYFPLRDIERLSTTRSKTSLGLAHLLTTPPWSIVLLVIMFVIFLASMCCVQLIHPIRGKRQRCASTCMDQDFEERQEDQKMVLMRSRSIGVLV